MVEALIMSPKEFVGNLGKPQVFLLGFYILSILMLILTQFLISRQEAKIDELREFNREVWEI